MKARYRIGCGVIALGLLLAGGEVSERFQQRSAIAANGFSPTENFPSRDTTYDGYLPEQGSVDEATFGRLYNHVAFPQSRGALVNLLGWPIAYDGNYNYYKFNSSEIAIYYTGDTALFFTVGY